MKKYFVIELENKEVMVLTPPPPNHENHVGLSVFLDVLPSKTDAQKYVFRSGKLKAIKKTKSDNDKLLALEKQDQIRLVDFDTKKQIKSGFEFDGQTFSLSTSAQMNWQGIFSLKQADLFSDTEVSTIDNESYTLIESKVNDFIIAGRDKLTQLLKDGRDKKKLIKNGS